MAGLPLRRNRDFVLLQVGQLLSSGGSELTTIAFPLLTLALTGSPARAGIVSFCRLLPLALLALPAGVMADQWGRRRLMIGADVVRAGAIGSLAALAVADRLEFWMLPVVAAIEGAGGALFTAGEAGALRAVVPVAQLPAAAATQTGRRAGVRLVGPPAGGALFAIGHGLPFVTDALSYAGSTVSLLLMRTPFEASRERDVASFRQRLAEGVRFMWRHPFLRTTALIFGVGNFVGQGLLFSLVVLSRRHGMSSAAVGGLMAAFAAAVTLGSLLSGVVRRRVPVHLVLVLELWAWLGCGLFLVWPSPYALVAGVLPAGLVVASTDSVVHGYRLAMTPDHVLSRSEAARSMIALSLAPLGPLSAGLLLDVSERAAVAVFVVTTLGLAVWGTASSAIRAVPPLENLDPDGVAVV